MQSAEYLSGGAPVFRFPLFYDTQAWSTSQLGGTNIQTAEACRVKNHPRPKTTTIMIFPFAATIMLRLAAQLGTAGSGVLR